MKNKQVKTIYSSKKKRNENHMELLLLGNEDTFHGNKSHYVYINSSNRLMCNKTEQKQKAFLHEQFRIF